MKIVRHLIKLVTQHTIYLPFIRLDECYFSIFKYQTALET